MTTVHTLSPSVAYGAVRAAWNQFKAAPTDTAAIDNYLEALEQITEEENELREAIRNYQRAYPNGEKELRRHARKQFEKMMYR